MNTQISLNQFAHLVKTVGTKVTIIGQSEPGIGKSAQLARLAKEMPGHVPCYIDCTLLDLGDFALPYVTEEAGMKVTRFAPNARFGFQHDKPALVMLDEIGKAMKSVKNVLLTLMLEHRIGDVSLPEGSIVFGTTNMTSDGVGDAMPAHARNRVCFVTIAKPGSGFNVDGSIDQDSWAAWALDNDVDATVIAWVREFPHALESYTQGDAQKDNPYIFNPNRAGQTAFVSPRSLERASDIVKMRDVLGRETTLAALDGAVGASAARDMQAFLQLADKLPTWAAIVKDPEGTDVPQDVTARVLLALRAVTLVDESTLTPWMTYLQRLDKELQALFCRSVLQSGTARQKIATSNRLFLTWASENSWVVA